VYYYCKCQTKS